MGLIRNQDYEQFAQIDDERIRESFRVLYDNTSALQAQLEGLVNKIVEATDLTDLQQDVSVLFNDTSISNATGSYTLPVATPTTLGGVKEGDNTDINSDGLISVPIATATTLGVVKVGSGISISANGTLTVP